jgi:AraC-like DNA-binding protein
MGLPAMATIPSRVLDTDSLPPRERFALWRDSLSVTHAVDHPDDCDPSCFRAYARGWDLGQALVVESQVTAQLLARSPRLARADQIDHYIIRLQRRGRWHGEAGEHIAEAGDNSVMVLDMARSSKALSTGIDNVNLLLPRDTLDAMMTPFDMHGLVLHGPMAALLRSHLEALVETLPHISREHASDIAYATCALVAACLKPSRATTKRAAAPLHLARLAEIRRYVDDHLRSPALSPETIAKALGLSRSTLYATCEPHGGVTAFIRQRRLERIHALLADPQNDQRISQVAYRHGFVSKAHFSRVFRDAFGYSPRETREAAPSAASERVSADRAYRTWVRQLGR